MPRSNRRRAFALYEVLIGLTIFVVGVLALGKAVENCLNASALTTEEDRVRQILANKMAEIQVTPGFPDPSHEFKIETGYGLVKLVQKSVPAALKETPRPPAGQPATTAPAGQVEVGGMTEVTLTALWSRHGFDQSKQIVFYVYRAG